MIDELSNAKQNLRKTNAQIRKNAQIKHPDAPQICAEKADDIAALFAPKIIAAYWPIRTELDPIPLLKSLMAKGMLACLPVTPQEGQPLSFHQWDGQAELEEGPYGTKQPSPSLPQIDPDLILAPLLAFDADCWRLGYGGGFYDRTLAALEAKGHKAHVIGIAYDEQQVEKVPTDIYDKALSAILTPTRLLRQTP